MVWFPRLVLLVLGYTSRWSRSDEWFYQWVKPGVQLEPRPRTPLPAPDYRSVIRVPTGPPRRPVRVASAAELYDMWGSFECDPAWDGDSA